MPRWSSLLVCEYYTAAARKFFLLEVDAAPSSPWPQRSSEFANNALLAEGAGAA